MAEMIHFICNHCYISLRGGKNRPFFLTQCGHLYCAKCRLLVEKQCLQCPRIAPRILLLQDPVQCDFAHYFEPLTNTLARLLQVSQFQMKQEAILKQRLEGLEQKYNVMKAEYWHRESFIKALAEKCKQMKAVCTELQRKVNAYENKPNSGNKYQTPLNLSGSTEGSTQSSLNSKFTPQSCDNTIGSSGRSVPSVLRSEHFKVPMYPCSISFNHPAKNVIDTMFFLYYYIFRIFAVHSKSLEKYHFSLLTDIS
ncbi:RING finger protein 212B-like [Orussus abietinus]|uniref:RING finger protein 212B-like n=1 Tax=Orussus abietinus TaxID=222816 RepID=UPI0006264164|nr:RING finger protein 212B-like [Orussus abietinus]